MAEKNDLSIRRQNFLDRLFNLVPESITMRVQEQQEMMNKDPIGYWSGFAGIPLTFAGQKAAGFGKAKIMDRIFEGVDQLPRFEISDEAAKVKNFDSDIPDQLENILDHYELFKQYPFLEKTGVHPLSSKQLYGNKGSVTPGWGGELKINIDKSLEKYNLLSTLLHEIQHIIQKKEGFAKGGSEDIFFMDAYRTAKELYPQYTTASLSDIASKAAFQKYKNLAGEVEARNVQKRMKMTEKERMEQHPFKTMDVPREKQIIKF